MERMTMEQLLTKYPEQWVFLTDVEKDSEGNLISGIPLGIYTAKDKHTAPLNAGIGGYFFKLTTREPEVGYSLP